MPSTTYERLSYPTRFLKSRGGIIGIIFLNTELKHHTFARRNNFYALFATNKPKDVPKRLFRAPVVILYLVKV